MRFDKHKILNSSEFFTIFIIFVLPPMLNSEKIQNFQISNDIPFILFLLKLIFLASFEEILYRIYLPFGIKKLYKSFAIKIFFSLQEILPVVFFALAHRYLGWLNVIYAFFMGIAFRILYLILKKRLSIVISFIIVAFIHSFHNFLVVLFFR